MLLELAPVAEARQSEVIQASVVKATVAGKDTIVIRPNQLDAVDGDVLKLCNNSQVISPLFSPSPHNKFGGGFGGPPGSGLKLAPGACTELTLRNPTDKPIKVGIYSEIQSFLKLIVLVHPKCTAVKGTRAVLAATGCTSPVARAGTFVLAPGLTEVKNPDAPSLTIQAAARTAEWNHTGQYGGAGHGGDWVARYTFHVPGTLVAGKTAQVTVGISVSNTNSQQPNGFAIGVLAPDFAQSLNMEYPNQASATKQYDVPISAGYTSVKELTITIGFVSAQVVYHYERAG
jgi:hypothetical protein